jgi:Adenylate and Guanylate cyclase catalytic domain
MLTSGEGRCDAWTTGSAWNLPNHSEEFSRPFARFPAWKIQLSCMTKNILETFGSFRLSERGEIFVKGRGAMKTYWLIGEDGKDSTSAHVQRAIQ